MLKELNIEEEYYTGQNDLVEDFYKPCLGSSIKYDRSVGYFRSSVFLIIGPQIIDFAKRGGKIRLLCSPSMTEADIEAISYGYKSQDYIEAAIENDVDQLLATNEVIRNTEALATLVKCGVLEIRIVFMPNAKGEYHAKLGVLIDEDENAVSFKGSVNESWTGWHERGNHETIDVYRSWKRGRDARQVERNAVYFENLWNNEIEGLCVVPFPELSKEKLFSIAKDNIDEINCSELIDYFSVAKHGLDINKRDVREKRTPLPHQLSALDEWRKRGCRGILEHATGSGKTFTALLALKGHLKEGGVALVLVPDRLLHKQWIEEITAEVPEATILKAGDGYNSWRKNKRLKVFTQPGDELGARVVLATMPTARLDDFWKNIFGGEHLMVVADEVHEIGSTQNSKVLSIDAGPRLGLSATPRRYGDPTGTQLIFDFFGDIVEPPFTLVDAIKSGRLVEYEYHPEPIHLSVEESEAYEEATSAIKREFARSKRDDSGKLVPSLRLQTMLIQRARIAKKARAKVPYAVKTIQDHYMEGESWLIYCEDQNQLSQVMDELREKGYIACEYHTSMKGAPSASLDWFKQFGGIMVSIRCLDQGVDIPKISHAIILASSQNPRQFIQRRGRVLRTCKGKYGAVIFDAVVVPLDLDLEPGQLSLMKSELQRSVQFSETAMNRSGARKLIKVAIDLGIDPMEVGLVDTDGIEETGEDDG